MAKNDTPIKVISSLYNERIFWKLFEPEELIKTDPIAPLQEICELVINLYSDLLEAPHARIGKPSCFDWLWLPVLINFLHLNHC